jgi:Tfp pilus assembly PilM family ATPase
MKHARFFDFFPTPKFLEMPAPGLALNDSGLKFIEFSPATRSLVVKRFGKATLPAGIISGGVIQDRESLVRALEDFKKSFDLRYIRTSLPEERSYLFQTAIPRVSKDELHTAIESTIEENVPLSVAEVVFDYSVLPSEPGAGEEMFHVSVSVVPEEVVMEYLDVFREAGFMPLHFNVESQAVARALVSPEDVGEVLVLNIDQGKAGLYLLSRGAVSFASAFILPMFSANPPSKEPAPESVLTALDAEVKRVLVYAETQADRKGLPRQPIESILLCGEASNTPGLVEHLERTHSVKIEMANVWKNVLSFDDHIPEISKEESLAYAVAIGLALPRHPEE